MKRWRVNFGNGQVSHSTRTRREAVAYIEACKAYGTDPCVSSYFVQYRDADGFWMNVRTQRKAAA